MKKVLFLILMGSICWGQTLKSITTDVMEYNSIADSANYVIDVYNDVFGHKYERVKPITIDCGAFVLGGTRITAGYFTGLVEYKFVEFKSFSKLLQNRIKILLEVEINRLRSKASELENKKIDFIIEGG